MTANGDRTIPATPRRREAAREQGLAPTAAAISWPLLAAFVLAAVPGWVRATTAATVAAVQAAAAGEAEEAGRHTLAMVGPTAIVVLAALVLLIGVRLLGDGAGWRLGRASFQFSRIDPFAGLRRLFSSNALLRSLLAVVGLSGLLGVVGVTTGPLVAAVRDARASLPGQQQFFVPSLVAAERFLWWFLAAATLVAVGQWLIQRILFERRIRMTPAEFREELRSLQADPKIRRMRGQ
jgi:flagellar biosynthetic protein FlhB